MSCPPCRGTGTLIRRHVLPFQCNISGTLSTAAGVTGAAVAGAAGRVTPAAVAARPPVAPTAHTLRADVADTLNSAAVFPTEGLITRCHAVPFQCTISVPPPDDPTAHALLAEITVTRSSSAFRFGLGL